MADKEGTKSTSNEMEPKSDDTDSTSYDRRWREMYLRLKAFKEKVSSEFSSSTVVSEPCLFVAGHFLIQLTSCHYVSSTEPIART